jgi:hypothetical protein
LGGSRLGATGGEEEKGEEEKDSRKGGMLHR